MPLLVVRLPSWLRAGSLLGEPVVRRWERLAAAAGLELATEGEGALAADGRVLTLQVDQLRAVLDGAALVLEDPARGDDLTDIGGERTMPRVAVAEIQAHVGLVVAAGGPHARLVGRREPVPGARALDPWEHAPVQDGAGLRGLEGRLLARRHEAEVTRGVRFVGAPPFLGPEVELEPGATVWSGSVLLGRTRVAAGAVVHASCHLTDTAVAAGAVLEPYTVAEGAEVGPGARVGPFAHLRRGTVLRAEARVGNFVETKQAVLGEGAKANHLAYLGDCEVGPRTNVGAGTITCNYDGAAKHRTTLGADVFVGTNSALVAPLVVGDEALIAAGSVVTDDVPAGALVLARAEQRTVADKGRAILARNRARKAKSS